MKRWVLGIVAACGVVLAATHILIWLPFHWTRDTTRIDFAGYYRAVQRWATGKPIYTDGFFYPPSFLLFVLPAAKLTFATFQKVWYTLVLLGFWAYAWGLARLAFRHATAQHVLAVGMLVAVTPGINYVLSFGNADIFVWALVAWGVAEESSILLLLGSAMKVYPIAAAYNVAVRGKRLNTMFLGSTCIGLATVVIVGPRPVTEWLHTGGLPVSRLVFFDSNVSAPVLLLRLLGCHDLDSGLAHVIFKAVPLVLAGVALVLTWRWSIRAQAVALVLMMTWSAPICWAFREPLLWTAVAVWWREHGVAVAERIQGWLETRRTGGIGRHAGC